MVTFSLFQTSLGACGIAWSGNLVAATALPEESDTRTAGRLRSRTGATEGRPPPAIGRAIAAITSLLEGERTDLSFIECDLSRLDGFSTAVYAATAAIPPGETLTYGAIARKLGDVRLARRVGQTLGANPFPIVIPCHRVLGADGRLTGFSANGGVETKLRLLAMEGALIGVAPGLFGDLPFRVRPRT